MEDFVVELSAEEELIREVIEPLLESEGYELVCLKLKRTQMKSLLVVFIDTRNKLNGIKIKDITDVSRLLSDVLDASFEDKNVLKGRYDLEVSSPGLCRPLTKRAHFTEAIGEKIKLRLKHSLQEAKNITGFLVSVLNDGVVIGVHDGKKDELKVDFSNVQDANIVFDFEKLKKTRER